MWDLHPAGLKVSCALNVHMTSFSVTLSWFCFRTSNITQRLLFLFQFLVVEIPQVLPMLKQCKQALLFHQLLSTIATTVTLVVEASVVRQMGCGLMHQFAQVTVFPAFVFKHLPNWQQAEIYVLLLPFPPLAVSCEDPGEITNGQRTPPSEEFCVELKSTLIVILDIHWLEKRSWFAEPMENSMQNCLPVRKLVS